MRLRPLRRPWRAVAVASCFLSVVGALAGCADDRAGNPTRLARPTVGPGETAVRVLQLNLCNSGRAGCYSGGRAVSAAAALIDQHEPEMVTLNEVCRDDVETLEQTMTTISPAATVATAFRAAVDRPTHAPVRCENGQEFGNGVVAVVPAGARGYRIRGGTYPDQDPDDPEERVWVCIDLATQFSACSTHTASTDTTVALAQCRYLLSSAAPMTRDSVILGGDLNLPADGSPGPQACLPGGYQRVDDGALQNVVVGSGIEVGSSVVIDMRDTTDHPGLLVDVVLSRH